jgi:Protein kinase domain
MSGEPNRAGQKSTQMTGNFEIIEWGSSFDDRHHTIRPLFSTSTDMLYSSRNCRKFTDRLAWSEAEGRRMAQEKKLATGQQFGDWTLQGAEPLGRGGNGVVWEAIGPSGRVGAIKFLHKNHFICKRFSRFSDEIRFLKAEAGRKGILPLLDANLPTNPTTDDRPWLVTPLATPFNKMELAGIQNLPALVERIRSVAETLAGLHAENKWHRDLKPDNLFDLDGVSAVGDFGLVDFPDKQAVTESKELVGPLFYVAPEMMTDAQDTPGGPGDVFALAKTLWVLASGQTFPLQGEQRADSPGLRLSTYCPHPRATILDRLLETATRHNAATRVAMQGLANELAAWLSQPTPETITLDLGSLAREYEAVFHSNNEAERRQAEFIQDVSGMVSVFDGLLERIASDTAGVTNIGPDVGEAFDLPPVLHYPHAFGRPRVLWRGARQVETKTGDMHCVRLQSFVQAEALSNEEVRIAVGHLVRYEAGISHSLVRSHVYGGLEATAPWKSAQLENELQSMYSGLIKNLGLGIQAFAEQVKGVSG